MRQSRALTALALCALAACGPAGEPSLPQAQRLVWEGQASGSQAPRRFTQPAGKFKRAWRVEGADNFLFRSPPQRAGKQLVLWFSGDDGATAIASGHLDARVSAIEVELLAAHRMKVAVSLVRRGAAGEISSEEHLGARLLGGLKLPQVLRYRRLPSPAEIAPFDELHLRVLGNPDSVFVFGVCLEFGQPADVWKRDADGPLFLGKDGRRAAVLSSEAPLRASIPQIEGLDLALDLGIPGELCPPGLEPVIEIQAQGEGGQKLSSRFPLASDAWLPAKLALSELGSGPATIEVQLHTSRPAVALLGDGRLISAGASSTPQPLVLLISSDTHRADHIGVQSSDAAVKTPAIDRLAARGVRFSKAWSSANITLPSHSALLTGVHPRDSGVLGNATSLRASASTLAENFAEAGFGTLGVISSRHLSHSISGFGQGFDRYFETSNYQEPADKSIARLLDWIDQDQGRPLFAFLHLFDVHGPYEPPPEFRPDVEGLGLIPKMTALYRGEVAYLDSELERLLGHPRVAAGITALTADHGESLGAHGLAFTHSEIYPDTVDVPLILAWPGAPAGLVLDGEVRQLDLGRTLLDLAGQARSDFPGRSLLAWVEAGKAGDPAPDQPTFALASGAISAAIRSAGWMLVLHLKEHRASLAPGATIYAEHSVELFQLSKDPGALFEISEQEPERAGELRLDLIEWLGQRDAAPLAESAVLSTSDLATLEQMGYAGEELEGYDEQAGALFPGDCECQQCLVWR